MIQAQGPFKAGQPIHSGRDLMRWRRQIGVSRPVFAILSACSERTLATEESRRRLNLQKERKLNETHRLLVGLCGIMNPNSIGKWLHERNPWFGERTPLEVIRSGQVDQVWAMIHHTRQSGYA